MCNIGILQYAKFLGANTVIGMAQKVGLTPPPPPISVLNVIELAKKKVAARPDVVAAPWAVLLCKFSDNLTEPFPMSFYQDLFTSSGVGTHNMVDYFRDASQWKLDVSGSKVFGWFTLDQKHSDYKGSGANPAGRNDLVNWAKAKAGLDLSPFKVVVVCLNVPTDLFGGLGEAVGDNGSMTPSAIGQEMGHGYGLDHSRADNPIDSPFYNPDPKKNCYQGIDYGDAWDTMSTACAYEAPDPKYTNIGPFLNAANMDGKGWLNGARVWTAPGAVDQTITLRPLANPTLPGWLVARINGYLVEFRVKESWDAAIPKSAVLVHRFQGGQSYIMSDTNSKQDLGVGDVFQVGDPNGALPWTKVQVLNIDSAACTATVRLAAKV